VYENTAYNYILGIPEFAFIPNKSPVKDQIFFGNIKQPGKHKSNDIDIELYSDSTVYSCAPSLTGASRTQGLPATGKYSVWGKVDAFDTPNPDFPPDSQPLCRPPILKWDYDESRGGILRLSDDAAYVLCSEKDGKRVLICISQVTDDPKLAEQIFKTFRWTE